MSRADYNLAEYEATVSKCNAALRSDPRNSELLRQRGEAKRKLGQLVDAVSDFNTALNIAPKCAAALHARGSAKRSLGNPSEAIRDFDAAIALEPTNAVFLSDRGSARQSLGKLEQALSDAQAALQHRPGFIAALQLRGEVQRKMGKAKEAVEDLDAVLKEQPYNVPALAGRGAALRAVGRREEALKDYDAAVSLTPRNPSVLAGRGVVRLELRMVDSAKADFESALNIDPSSAFARWGVDRVSEVTESAGLQITITGLAGEGLNQKYIERRRPGFSVNGFPTYWSIDGAYFLYYSEQESRWKGTRYGHFAKVKQGASSAIFAAPPHVDIRSPTNLVLGWNEWDGFQWVVHKKAGVSSVVNLEVNLHTIYLDGFNRPELNVRYAERWKLKYQVNGHETYWSSNGLYFLYWSSTESRWKGTVHTDLPRVQGGKNLGFIGGPENADITSPDMVKGWHEWDGEKWIFQQKGGVIGTNTLATVQVHAAAEARRAANAKAKAKQQQARVAAPPPKRQASPPAQDRPGKRAKLGAKMDASKFAPRVPKVPLFVEPSRPTEDWT